ncbi:cystatin-2-like [Python bivittatus]|uniref:Cystatin-2-like n=1 Tax=Python bivittatus TaxID=176946 RepID=A0A9F2NIF4_PYTBI|nr:cystatin-2-like [Python bivittatus]
MALSRRLLVCSILLLSCLCKQALLQRLPGGLTEASLEDPGVRRALQFAINEYNRASNDMYSSRVSEVVRVQTQVVSGLKYYFTVKVGRTVCRKGVSDLENCALHEGPNLAKTMTCNFEVYSIPWMNSISLQKSNCA